MRQKIIGMAVFFLAAASLACRTLLPPAEPSAVPAQGLIPAGDLPRTQDEVPRLSVAQAKFALDSGTAILVDVRNPTAYAEGHAAGARSIPLDEFENNIGNLPLEKDQWIITYCT